MELYRIGKVVSIGKTYIILESRYSGEIVHVIDPKLFALNKVQKIYIYTYKNDYFTALYGFSTFKERSLFENLINVNNIGPKIAINLLKNGINNLITLIINNQIEELVQTPLLGIKGAKQIVFDLREKYLNYFNNEQQKNHQTVEEISSSNCNEIRQPLKILGFNQEQINYAVKNLTWHESLEVMIENAIKLIANVKAHQS